MRVGRRASLGLLGALSLVSLSIAVFDVYEDWVVQGNTLVSTLVENGMPLLIAGGLVYATVHFSLGDDDDDFLRTVATRGVLGLVALATIAAVTLAIQLRQGEVKPVVVVGHLAGAGAVAGLGVGYSNAAAERAREEIAAERDRWRALFSNDPAAIVDLRFEEGEPLIKAANGPFHRFIPDSATDPTGRPLFEVVDLHTEDGEQLRRHVRADEVYEVDRTVETARTPVHLRFRLVPYDDDRAFGIYQDLTELEETRRELEATVAELSASNERLEEFASVVSHDLRNPLNAAQTGVEVLAEEAEGDLAESEPYELVQQSHQRMADIIDGLLALAKEGRDIEEPVPVDLGAVARESWTVEDGPATLVVEAERTVLADPSRLRQLFENLFRNAVEHGPDDVTVRVEDTPASDADGEPAGGETVGFAVVDDGPGVPEDAREQVFEPGVTTTTDGTGFGLSIVRRIAEAHGWEVTLTESESGGARFEFRGVERA